ncbi:hypothetical protein QZH41_009928, partial [Actinostola sp. cb2023]
MSTIETTGQGKPLKELYKHWLKNMVSVPQNCLFLLYTGTLAVKYFCAAFSDLENYIKKCYH